MPRELSMSSDPVVMAVADAVRKAGFGISYATVHSVLTVLRTDSELAALALDTKED